MVAELLKYPNIDPNQRDKDGWTPFMVACCNGASTSACLLLNDVKVNINCRNTTDRTGLMQAPQYGSTVFVEQMLASLRHIESEQIKMAIEITKKLHAEKKKKDQHFAIFKLLEHYQARPFNTVKKLRKIFKLKEHGPVSIFIHVVLVSDGYYTLIRLRKKKNQDKKKKKVKARQFFHIMINLPMICNRMFRSPKNFIKSQLIDKALKFMVVDGVLR